MIIDFSVKNGIIDIESLRIIYGHTSYKEQAMFRTLIIASLLMLSGCGQFSVWAPPPYYDTKKVSVEELNKNPETYRYVWKVVVTGEAVSRREKDVMGIVVSTEISPAVLWSIAHKGKTIETFNPLGNKISYKGQTTVADHALSLGSKYTIEGYWLNIEGEYCLQIVKVDPI